MRRSLLFIPGNIPGMLQTADIFEADSVIFDLEDAISITEKDSARTLLKHFLETFHLNIEVIIRINGMDTEFFIEDLEYILTDAIDAIMLPKANVNDIIKLDQLIKEFEVKRNLKKNIKIIPIIELASSLLEVEEIVKQNRIDGVLLGAEDLTSDMEVERTKNALEIYYPRARIALACISKKIDAIDTPFTNVLDDEGLIEDCKLAKNIGLNAKACIHPNQVECVNNFFSPTSKQIEYALRIIEASKKNEGLGVFSLDGKMIDKPIISRAEKILSKAKKFGLL